MDSSRGVTSKDQRPRAWKASDATLEAGLHNLNSQAIQRRAGGGEAEAKGEEEGRRAERRDARKGSKLG